MADSKMSERIGTVVNTAVITVAITGALSVVGSALTNGALIGALKVATQDDIKALRKETGDLPQGSATVSVGDVAADLQKIAEKS